MTARAAVIATFVALTAIGCSVDTSADQECLAAFRNAETRALPPYRVSPLDDAIRACADVEAWRFAWDAVPAAHPDNADAVAFLVERCALEELASTALCQSIR